MAIRISKYARTHVGSALNKQSKQKQTSIKRTASRRNANAKSKRVATRIK